MANTPKSGPTMHEVAKEAKTSIATVSRVINGNRPVSPELEKRVRAAMKKLHYHPSSLARSLKTQQTRLVGILIPLLEQPSYTRMASGIEQTLFEQGYRGMICNSEEDESRENNYIEMLLQQRADGIIINSSARNPEYIAELEKNNVPIVLFDRSIAGLDCNQVFCDNSRGGYTAVEHLAKLGHKRVGLIAAPTYPEVIQRRLQGALQAIRDYDLDDDPNLVLTGDTQMFDMGYEAGVKLLQLENRPTAIFALTDVTAVGVMHAANELGLHMPRELSIIGYDDLTIAGLMIPSLSTVRQPLLEMGQTAAELLIKSINDPDLSPEKVVLETRLVVRESTAPPS